VVEHLAHLEVLEEVAGACLDSHCVSVLPPGWPAEL
jgi:hypothetical protein